MVGFAGQRDGSGTVCRGDQTLQIVQSGYEAGVVRGCLRGQRGANQWSGEMGTTVGIQMRENPLGLGKQASHVFVIRLATGQATVHVSLQHHPRDGVAGDAGAYLAARQ